MKNENLEIVVKGVTSVIGTLVGSFTVMELSAHIFGGFSIVKGLILRKAIKEAKEDYREKKADEVIDDLKDVNKIMNN